MKIKIITLAVLSLLFCTVILSGCETDVSPADTSAQTDAGISDPAVQVTEGTVTKADENEPQPGVMVDINGEISEKMYKRSLLSEGNLARLHKAMKKAESGESITVGVIGGSITQGSSASNPQNSYASKFRDTWQNMFPSCEVKFVNAGVGGTDSYLGVHRADKELLVENPDVVVVEFSVNDWDKTMNKYSYDSLVRKILNAESSPAVILLFMTMEDGNSFQETHREIGTAYELPMLSYREAVIPEISAGNLVWKDISPDNIHPNDAGHGIVSRLLEKFLKNVYDGLDEAQDGDTEFDIPALTKDYYRDAALYNASQITASSSEGFEIGENRVYGQYSGNFVTETGGTISFDVECRNFGVFFLRTTDGKSGTYEVYVDGERKGRMEADFTGGWGNYGFTQQFIIGNDTLKHKIEIKPAEGSEALGITILSLMIS